MKAVELLQRRVVLSEDAFAELVVWILDKPLAPSEHWFKYRLAYVVTARCVVLYDNERGKGDHRHYEDEEERYEFTSPEQLVEDFGADIERWNRENGRP